VQIEEAMTADPYVVDADAPLSEVAATMAERHLGCAIVTEQGRVVGIFTTVDALRAVADAAR
jgi:acetoin utilization protein AcuB